MSHDDLARISNDTLFSILGAALEAKSAPTRIVRQHGEEALKAAEVLIGQVVWARAKVAIRRRAIARALRVLNRPMPCDQCLAGAWG